MTLWASGFVGIRSAGRDLSPGTLALGRLVVASLALGVLALARREGLPPKRALPGIALCGVLWFALYSVVLNEAEHTVDAGTAAMLVNVGPILIAVLADTVLHEGFPRRLLAGCATAFAGAIVIGYSTSDSGIAPSWGAVLCLVAALAYAGGVVAQKPQLVRVSPFQMTWLACAGRSDRVPAVHRITRPRHRGRPRVSDRLDNLPRHRAHGHRIHRVGVCAVADDGGTDGIHDVTRHADGHLARLGAPR